MHRVVLWLLTPLPGRQSLNPSSDAIPQANYHTALGLAQQSKSKRISMAALRKQKHSKRSGGLVGKSHPHGALFLGNFGNANPYVIQVTFKLK